MPEEQEPADSTLYSGVTIYRDTLQFILRSLRFYKVKLEEEAKVIIDDPDLKALLELRSYQEPEGPTPIEKEIKLVGRMIEWYENIEQKEGVESWDYEIGNFSHGVIRQLKSICLLYLNHLRNARNILAARPNLTAQSIRVIDDQIAHFEEKMNSGGVFARATPIPLLLAQQIQSKPLPIIHTTKIPENLAVSAPPPLVLDRMPILDQQLRDRCLDIYANFEASKQHDRFDQVLSEATRILETRLRGALNGAPGTGLKLANQAFGGASPLLVVSGVPDEQEAVLALFRGIFGHVRNPSHHKLLGELSPQRTMQVLGLIDYAIFLIETAMRGKVPPPSP